MTRRCPRCGKTKPVDEFVRSRASRNGFHGYCKPCFNVATRRSREDLHGSNRNFFLKRRYNVSEEEVGRLITRQGGKCAICREGEARHLDHDHTTGTVRGVLCFNCNRGLGYFEDGIRQLFNAIDYVEGGLPDGWVVWQ